MKQSKDTGEDLDSTYKNISSKHGSEELDKIDKLTGELDHLAEMVGKGEKSQVITDDYQPDDMLDDDDNDDFLLYSSQEGHDEEEEEHLGEHEGDQHEEQEHHHN